MTDFAVEQDVPAWCDFFDAERFEEFCAEVDDACGCFGADGQDLSGGRVRLATGAHSAIHAFPLGRLAQRCRDASRDEWAALCFARIDAWSDAAEQAAWLERASFDQVRDGLRLHPYAGGARYSGTEPDDPREWFRLPQADGGWLGLVVEAVPAPYDGAPEIDTQVHNAAVTAWGVEPDRLVEIAGARA